MGHFTRIRGTGFWTYNSVVLDSEFETFDGNLAKAINGDDGGTWAPAAVITIGGAGVTVTGQLTAGSTLEVTGALTANGAVAINDGLTAASFVTLSGGLAVHSASTFTFNITATSSTWSGAVTFNGTTAHNDVATFDDVVINGALAAGGLSVFDGVAQFNQPVTLADPLTCTGDGHIRKRVALAGNANATYSVSTADLIVVNVALSAIRDYTLDSVGAAQGSVIRIARMSVGPTYDINVKRSSDGATVYVLQSTDTSAEFTFVTAAGGWLQTG